MKHYLSLYWQFVKNCWMRELEFRLNLIIWTFMDFLWFGLLIVSVELIFGQVDSIAGWTKKEVLLLTCVQALFMDFLWTFVLQNLNNFSHLIRKGGLDYYLLKPVNLRFLVSARYLEFDHFLRILFLIFLIPNFLNKMGITITVSSLAGFVLLFSQALFIFYNLFFLITTTNFWFVKLFNLEDLFDNIAHVGKFPVYIFKGGMRFFFVYILPVAFIATFPVQFLLGRGDLRLVLLGLLLGIITFAFSEWFWRFALKHYSSASN